MREVRATTLLCPVMIGRAPALAALDTCLELTREGKAQTLLVSGEAGIGKSRFVAEAKAQATSRAMWTLQGNCFEPDRALPYAPLVDLLRDLVASQSEAALAELMGAGAPDLVKLSPEVAAWLPAIAPTSPT